MTIIVSTFDDSVAQLTKVLWYLEVVFLTSDKFRRHPVVMRGTFNISENAQDLIWIEKIVGQCT
jgi:hypothetical protein